MDYLNKTNPNQTCVYCMQPCGKAKDYVPPKDLVYPVDVTESAEIFPEQPCVVSACQPCKSILYLHRYVLLTVQSRIDFLKTRYSPKKPSKSIDEIREIVEKAKLVNAAILAKGRSAKSEVPLSEVFDREKLQPKKTHDESWIYDTIPKAPSASPVQTETSHVSPAEPPDDF